jgi:hypothetical protein
VSEELCDVNVRNVGTFRSEVLVNQAGRGNDWATANQ